MVIAYGTAMKPKFAKYLVLLVMATVVGFVVVPTLLALFGDDDDQSRPVDRSDPWTAHSLTMQSEALDAPVELSVLSPEDPRGRALLVLLHGRGGSPESWTRQPVPNILRRLDERAPVVIAVDGGESSYWHDRSTGDWEAMLVDDLLPFARRHFGTDPERVGLAGFSMGGFGALSVVARHPDTLCVVGSHEPAIWQTAGETAAGAFDDAEDFDDHDVIEAASNGELDDVPIWLDRGRADAFIAGQDALLEALHERRADVTFREYEGDHSMKSVRPHLKEAFEFYAASLERCS